MRDRPNIVMVVLDTTRADVIGNDLPGSTFSDLAGRGTLFTRAVSPAPWTLPAHGSLFSGLEPFRHGLTGDLALPNGQLRPVTDRIGELADRWLPLRLHGAGYETFAASANPWITPRMGWSAGFDTFIETWRDVRSPRWQVEGEKSRRPLTSWMPSPAARAARWGKRSVDAARGARDNGALQAVTSFRSWLRGRSTGAPYFAFFNLMEAHMPYLAPRPFGPRGSIRRVAAANVNARLTNEFVVAYNVRRQELPPTDLAFLKALYRGGISYLDSRLGDIASEIETDRDTILVVVGDHGENLGEHHLLGHQGSLAETLLHVPLLVAGPEGIVPRGASVQPVSTRLVPATILGAAGLEASGPSLFTRSDDAPIVSWYESAYSEAAGARRMAEGELAGDREAQRALRTRAWAARRGELKLVVGSDDSRRLYDLAADPGEEHDLSSSRPDLMQDFADVAVPFEPAAEPGADVSSTELDEIESHLGMLGYL
jgi:arylsulfatase A-like enzyme